MPAAGTPILDVRDLRTQFFTDAGIVRAVDGVTFSVAAGETLGIVGESGSGKSVTALSLMRLLEEPSRIVGGEVRFQGRDVLAMNADELRALRGDGIAMVFQDPMTSLNPVLRIARQLVETMRAHGRFDDEEATTARRVAARPHGDHRAGARDQFLSASVLRRHAPARHARDGLCQRARAADRRRADHRARRHHPGADPRPDRGAQPRLRRGDHSHQPRARRDRECVPARHRDVCRRGGGGGADRAGAGRSAPSLYLGADQCGAADRPASPRHAPADHHRGRAARSARDPVRLPVRGALSVPHRQVRRASGAP